MRVIVPYAASEREGRTGLYPAVRAALEADGITAEYTDVGRSPSAYHDLLARLWTEGEGFAIVEHDIVVRPGAIAELAACSEPWCCSAYMTSVGPLIGGLGLARFSDLLLREHPSVVRSIDHLPPDGTPRRAWQRLDTRLKQVLTNEGIAVHAHYGGVAYHRRPDYADRVVFNCTRCGAAIPRERYTAGPAPFLCPACDG